jgi:hypothetical protein
MKHSTAAAKACGMEARRPPTFPTTTTTKKYNLSVCSVYGNI